MVKRKTAKATKTKQSRNAAKKSLAIVGPNTCIAGLKLKTVRLIETHCTLNIVDSRPLTEVGVNIGTGQAIEKHESEFVARVFTSADVSSTPVGVDDGSKLSIVVKTECAYVSQIEPSQDDLSTIMLMGIMTSWPTIRDIVNSISARTGQNPILLPILFIDPATATPSFLVADPHSG